MVARTGRRRDARRGRLGLVTGVALAHIHTHLILVLLLLRQVRAVGTIDIRTPPGAARRLEQSVERIDRTGIKRGLRAADLAHIRHVVTDIMRLTRDQIFPRGDIHIRQVVVGLLVGARRCPDIRREDQIRRRGRHGIAARLVDTRENEHGAYDDQHRQRHRQPETFVLHADPSRIKTKPLFAQNRRRRESYLMQLSFFYFFALCPSRKSPAGTGFYTYSTLLFKSVSRIHINHTEQNNEHKQA